MSRTEETVIPIDPNLEEVKLLDELKRQESRPHFINTAVKFLLNPRVRRSSLLQKQTFLRQKGLTADEIDIACQKAGAYTDEQNNTMQVLPQTGPPPPPYYYDSKVSFWMKARDIANLVALFSIGSYSLYSLWKRYMSPFLFGTRSSEQNLSQLLESMARLNESMTELTVLVRSLHPQQLSQAVQVSRGSRDPAADLQDLRQELSSIKGLLLSRNQFPSSPGIPSWQMLETEEAEDPAARRGRKERKGSARKSEPGTSAEETAVEPEEAGPGVSSTSARKQSSVDLDSNNGFHSGSSCEVVFMGGKNDSNSDPDHSDD